jgi:hypothetical protein
MMLNAVLFAMCFAFSSAALRDYPTPEMYADALKYLGATCDAVTANGCNAFQLPMYSGTSFVPSLVAKVTSDKVFIDTTQSRSQDTSVEYETSVSSVTKSDTTGFDIGGGLPVPQLSALFSLGVQHSQLVSTMHEKDTTNYYSEISRQYTVFTASLNDSVTLLDTVQQAAMALPDACNTPSEEELWLAFFTKFGTHYVKSVTFGGTMKMYTFLQSSVEKDARIKQSDWNMNFAAKFDKMANINFTFPSSSAQQSYEAFSTYTFSEEFFSYGGDQSVQMYYDWLKTVETHPAPVHTTISSLKDLIDTGKDFDSAFQMYLTRCPHTDNGICNGYGGCDLQQQICNCASMTYKETDGNCYAECPSDCGGQQQGQCRFGKCKCTVNADGFGFMGSDCSIKCGVREYTIDGDTCFRNAQDEVINHCTADGCDLQGGTCWCQKYKISDSDMQASNVVTGTYLGATYECDTSKRAECITCDCMTTIECTYGYSGRCPGAPTHTIVANSSSHNNARAVPIKHGNTRTSGKAHTD